MREMTCIVVAAEYDAWHYLWWEEAGAIDGWC